MLAAAAMGALACSGNNVKYDVTGANAPEDGVQVFLVDQLTSEPIDSAVVAEGAYKMKGKAAKEAPAQSRASSSWCTIPTTTIT